MDDLELSLLAAVHAASFMDSVPESQLNVDQECVISILYVVCFFEILHVAMEIKVEHKKVLMPYWSLMGHPMLSQTIFHIHGFPLF